MHQGVLATCAGLRCWCLNFRSRVKLASVKNFQLQCCDADMAEELAAAVLPAPGPHDNDAAMTRERRLRQVRCKSAARPAQVLRLVCMQVTWRGVPILAASSFSARLQHDDVVAGGSGAW